MKISVLIIAYNEEKYIRECIESLLKQTKQPDEIVLLAHNCTDKTKEIGESFPITVVPFNGARGLVYALLEGLNNVSGDIVLCIDGDSNARNNWVEVMTNTLENHNNVLVGSWVEFRGTFFGAIYNIYSKYSCILNKKEAADWIWGPSHAFWGRDKNIVRDILKKSIDLSNKLNLPRNPTDYWLALFMGMRGNIEWTNKTSVVQYTKETSMKEMISRRIESRKNKRLMDDYFRNAKESLKISSN